MPSRAIPENTARVLAITLVGWGVSVAWAAAEGVFARLEPGAAMALALFAAGYAAATYALDAPARAMVHRASRSQVASLAVVADIALAIALVAALRHGDPVLALARWPLALAPYFGMPLAVVAHIAALAAPAAPPLRSSAARSPGANPAAP
jgi:hypothetical protein